MTIHSRTDSVPHPRREFDDVSSPVTHGPTVLLPLVLLVILPIAFGFLMSRPPPPFVPTFAGPDRLVTNERAYHRPHMPGVRRSMDWWVTSGSLFARDGAGWTGPPDDTVPNAGSTDGTGSAIFRAVTRRDDFLDVTVRLRLRIEALTTFRKRHAYDGVHLFLRYQSPDELYGVTVFRQDGLILIKRKNPDGQYVTIAGANRSTPMNTWIDVVAEVVTLDSGSVRITLRLNGEVALIATDRGRRGDPIRNAGRVGLRGDNCQFSFRDFRADSGR